MISSGRIRRLRSWVVLAALPVFLSGCASTIADMPVVGLPEGTPARPSVQADYPAVHDMPPRRAETPLNTEEQQKLEKELIAAREGQGARADAIAKTESEPARKTKVEAARKKPTGAARTEAAGTGRNP
jgi:hypothetical protein